MDDYKEENLPLVDDTEMLMPDGSEIGHMSLTKKFKCLLCDEWCGVGAVVYNDKINPVFYFACLDHSIENPTLTKDVRLDIERRERVD